MLVCGGGGAGGGDVCVRGGRQVEKRLLASSYKELPASHSQFNGFIKHALDEIFHQMS